MSWSRDVGTAERNLKYWMKSLGLDPEKYPEMSKEKRYNFCALVSAMIDLAWFLCFVIDDEDKKREGRE